MEVHTPGHVLSSLLAPGPLRPQLQSRAAWTGEKQSASQRDKSTALGRHSDVKRKKSSRLERGDGDSDAIDRGRKSSGGAGLGG